MAHDTPTPLDEEPVVIDSPRQRYLRFYFYQLLFSLLCLVLLIIFIPRWFPPLGDWLFPYAKKAQVEKQDLQLSSLSKDLKSQETGGFNERLRSFEERLQGVQNTLENLSQKKQTQPPLDGTQANTAQETSKPQEQSSERVASSSVAEEQAYFIEALLLCQEIEGRLFAEQDYQTPLALLAALLKTPEEKAWLGILNSTVSTPKESTETLTANWPSWLKPLQNFFTIQPLTDKTSPELSDKRIALQKLKDVLIMGRQKASLVVTNQEIKS